MQEKLPDTQVQMAKALYFNTPYSPQKIASLVGIKLTDLTQLIFGSNGYHTTDSSTWFYKKEVAGESCQMSYREIEPLMIAANKASTLAMLTDQTTKMQEYYLDPDRIMQIEDLAKLVDIFSSIDKIDRLEQGRSTAITSTELDRIDATEIVDERRRRSDYIDADYKELKDGKD